MAQKPLRHECDQQRETRWYLMVDSDRFHVYVGVRIAGQKGVLRIDWRDNSRLELTRRRHDFERGHEAIPIGTTPTYCKACLVQRMRELHLQHYQLFHFNCRTVTYLVLTRVQGFDKNAVYQHFVDDGILCGIDSTECVSLNELHHYLNWSETQGRPSACVLF
jgi:hypothetical protein